MGYALVTGVALFLGFNLGVLVARLLAITGPSELAEGIRTHGHVASAWWR